MGTAILVAGTPIYAGGFSFGGEVETTFDVTSEKALVVLTPEFNYTLGLTNFELSSPISVVDSHSTTVSDFILFDALYEGTRPQLDLEITHLYRENLVLSAATSYDLNTDKRSSVVVGATYKF